MIHITRDEKENHYRLLATSLHKIKFRPLIRSGGRYGEEVGFENIFTKFSLIFLLGEVPPILVNMHAAPQMKCAQVQCRMHHLTKGIHLVGTTMNPDLVQDVASKNTRILLSIVYLCEGGNLDAYQNIASNNYKLSNNIT